ncbi:cysteine desulfurase [Patescibacteria group bacterium]|nr:cysteine desulfurase [Patescibacteria group bacterium]
MRKRIYLDYAASTPVDKKVLKAMLPYVRNEYGNPSSVHSFGQKARVAIEEAREKAAHFLHCSASEIIFTSGATEANNLAIQGVIKRVQERRGKPHIVTSQIEHESVLAVCQQLEKEGVIQVSYLAVTREGLVRPKDVAAALKPNTVLVSVMYANSEIGTIQPIGEIGKILAERRDVLFHSDAVQAAHFLDCNVEALRVDLLTLSAHKIYGPKGVGILYVKEGTLLHPLIIGGGQEFDVRSGTENVAAIVGMGVAVEELGDPRLPVTNIKIRQLRDKLMKTILKKIPDSKLTGFPNKDKRLSNNTHVRFKGIEGRDVVIVLDQKGIAVSTGSACSERTQEPSHVLLALGLSARDAESSLRITVGKYTTPEEIDRLLYILPRVVEQLRKKSA